MVGGDPIMMGRATAGGVWAIGAGAVMALAWGGGNDVLGGVG
jgi:hypothetical protein